MEKKREVMIVFKIAKPHEGGELTNTNMAGCGIMRGEVKVKVVREVKLRARRKYARSPGRRARMLASCTMRVEISP